jgi:hypothetical protein
MQFYIYKKSVRAFRKSNCIRVYSYFIWSSFIKSGGFATVNVAVEAINFEESIDKTTSGDTGSSEVFNFNIGEYWRIL